MKSFLPFFFALILGTALFKCCHTKSVGAESAGEPELDRDETAFQFPEEDLSEETLEEGFDVLGEIQPESKLSKRQRRLARNDRRRAKKSSSKGSKGDSKGSNGSNGCPTGSNYSKGSNGSKGGCVANAPPPVLQPVYIAPLAPVPPQWRLPSPYHSPSP